MTDTQWPRWEVFEQEQPDAPYRNVGSVHASDSEMALENARDVFVRRPHCVSLWVVRADQIFAQTAQELAAASSSQPTPATLVTPDSQGRAAEPYFVFQKQTQRATETYVVLIGEVAAHTPPEALALAQEKFGAGPVFVWWVCPARAITPSAEVDVESMFEPCEFKPYRQPQFYKVVAQLHQIKSAKGGQA